MNKKIAVLGMHTDAGKTVVSSVITEALQCDYWKPVQAGGLDWSDRMNVRHLVANTTSVFHEEQFRFTQPMSPHAAAKIDGVKWHMNDLVFPKTENTLLIETAGGVHSPLTEEHTMTDFVAAQQLTAILVVRHYLGSINHTICAIESIRKRNIRLLGLVFTDHANAESESFIMRYCNIERALRIPHLELTREAVSSCAASIKNEIEAWISEL
jgi:dethiobiotin synthetase